MSDEPLAREDQGIGGSGDGAAEHLIVIPAAEVKPEDVGTLSLSYSDGVPVLTATGGTHFPAELVVVNEEGAVVATYAAANPPAATRVLPTDIYKPTRPAAEQDGCRFHNIDVVSFLPGVVDETWIVAFGGKETHVGAE